jgi:hypothetical protein
MQDNTNVQRLPRVAIVGGGVAGATAAVHMGELGIAVSLLEKGADLVNGPPICHLHAGGNLYREISQQQCLELLQQSVETSRLFKHTLNVRPTVIVLPKGDSDRPEDLQPRLNAIKHAYQQLVEADPKNQVLGDPEDYYRFYSRADLERLSVCEQPSQPGSTDEWLIPFAKYTDLEQIQFPVIVVQEYGWSVFRLAASVMMTLNRLPNCHVLTRSTLVNSDFYDGQWHLTYIDELGKPHEMVADYLINACGYETGKLDDMVNQPRERIVEFKAAYTARWSGNKYEWPEVVFHGRRGTPQGMAQLTPYASGVFQLHGMTEDITLFKDGLVKTPPDSAQPVLPEYLQIKLAKGWSEQATRERTLRAIEHVGQFIPMYRQAQVCSKPLFGAQQIPGRDETLRAADVSFSGQQYARIEIVKGSSALEAARKIVDHWHLGSQRATPDTSIEQQHPVCISLRSEAVEAFAIRLAQSRSYPVELAKVIGR